jgi:glutamate-1-semialdehyde 2,1-aminomutase
MNFKERLNKVIPGGAHTYSRGSDQFPSNAPQILTNGSGAYVWDGSGQKFLDYGMALRAVTLGYGNQRVNRSAIKQIELGNNLTRPSLVELEAAEVLSELIPSCEMVKFAKNGSNVTTAALKIARAYTGRKFICVPRQHPFFSFDDWFIGVTGITKGVPAEHSSLTLTFDYNDIKSLEFLFQQYPNQIAGVMLEPVATEFPCSEMCYNIPNHFKPCSNCEFNKNSFLYQVKNICEKNGTLFILDEMITGFRYHLKGAQHFFGIEPDLCTFGKAMANGFSLAAICGKREFMQVGSIEKVGEERTFLLSTTHGGEMCSLGAFLEVVKIYQDDAICEKLWEYGFKLKKSLSECAQSNGVNEFFSVLGPDVSPYYTTRDGSGQISMAFRTLFSQEMIKQGVLMPWIAISSSHGDNELRKTIEAADHTFKIYKKALKDGINKFLEGPEIKPVFRKLN